MHGASSQSKLPKAIASANERYPGVAERYPGAALVNRIQERIRMWANGEIEYDGDAFEEDVSHLPITTPEDVIDDLYGYFRYEQPIGSFILERGGDESEWDENEWTVVPPSEWSDEGEWSNEDEDE